MHYHPNLNWICLPSSKLYPSGTGSTPIQICWQHGWKTRFLCDTHPFLCFRSNLQKMRTSLCFVFAPLSFLAFLTCSSFALERSNQNKLSALRKALFADYDKLVKPDGLVTVRYSLDITDIALCPRQQVRNIGSCLCACCTCVYLVWSKSMESWQIERKDKAKVVSKYFRKRSDKSEEKLEAHYANLKSSKVVMASTSDA